MKCSLVANNRAYPNLLSVSVTEMRRERMEIVGEYEDPLVK